jgi:hypothetical protein
MIKGHLPLYEKLVFESRPVIYIEIGVPILGEDLNRFFAWCGTEKIWTSVRAGMSGGGQFIGMFEPADGEKVVAWLLENGFEKLESIEEVAK